jgi:hypothetical protein
MKPARPSSSSIRARRTSSLRRACALAIVAALPLGMARPARAQPQVTTAQADLARELFRKAAKEYAAGQPDQAYRDYLTAWNTQNSPDTAGNLGAIELELGYYREAAEHAAYAIAHFPPTGSKKQRAALVSVLADACKQIGVLTIQANVPGATVSIDGKPVGHAPLDGDVYIEPGDHTVLAEAPDHDPAQRKIHVEKGSTTPLALALVARTPTGPATTTTPTNWPRPIAVAGFLTAGAGFAVGTALAIMSKIKATDADTAGQQIDTATHSDPGACLPGHAGSTSSCATLASLNQSRDTFASTALWMFVGATVVTVGTVVYSFVVPRYAAPAATPGATSGMSVVPVVTPSGGAVVMQGSF